jgi:hypothetical protein
MVTAVLAGPAAHADIVSGTLSGHVRGYDWQYQFVDGQRTTDYLHLAGDEPGTMTFSASTPFEATLDISSAGPSWGRDLIPVNISLQTAVLPYTVSVVFDIQEHESSESGFFNVTDPSGDMAHGGGNLPTATGSAFVLAVAYLGGNTYRETQLEFASHPLPEPSSLALATVAIVAFGGFALLNRRRHGTGG